MNDLENSSPYKAIRIPEKLREIRQLNLETDTLVIVLTEQLNAAKAKLVIAESEIITHKSKLSTTDSQQLKSKREIDNLNDQNASMMKEVQDVTKQKDRLEMNFGRLDQIERDFERAIKKVEEQEDLIKAKNEQIDDLKKTQKNDKKATDIDKNKIKSALEILAKGEQRIASLLANQCARIKLEIAGKFDKLAVTKEFEILATTLKQLQETVTPAKIDPKGASEESFQKQLLEANKKTQKLETEMKDLKFEFKEYKIENDNFKMQAEKLDQDNQGLKKENGRLILQNQKQFSDTAEARKLLSQNQQELNTLMSKLQ